jgi:hypothetical protein
MDMKTRLTILMAVMALLLLGTVASAQPSRLGQSLGYTVQAVTVTGGRYQLISPGSQISEAASGGGYRLLSLASPSASSDSGCCCTYLPCVVH